MPEPRRNLPSPPRRASRAGLIAVSAALSLFTVFSHAAQPPATPPTAAAVPTANPDPSPAELLATLNDTAATPSDRDRAAERLVALATQPDALELLRGQFSTPANGSICLTIARAVAANPGPCDKLFEPFYDYTTRASADQLPSLLPALASWRTRDALRAIHSYTDSTQPAPVREAAFQSLARLTGREDLNADRTQWAAYVDRAIRLPEAEWNAELLKNLATRIDTLAARESASLARLSDTLRKLYIATPQDQRSALLASMLLDDMNGVRSVAFELASRELSSTRQLDKPVADACIQLLKHSSAKVRQSAALLLSQLSPEGAGPAVAAALAAETDPQAAAALLAASARWPSRDLVPHVLAWLTYSPQTRGPAAQTALALARAGYIYDEESRARILNVLRPIPASDLPPSAGPLLILLGNDEDRAAAGSLLRAPDPALRSATAEAAVVYPELLNDLLNAAAFDPQLWDPCVRALGMHQATADSFGALAGITAPSPEIRRDGLSFLASVMPAVEILASAKRFPEGDPLRELVLAPLTDPNRMMSLRPGSPAYDATMEGLVLLARIRLTKRQPDAALLALDAIPETTPTNSAPIIARARTMALLALNRADEAADLPSSADDWLDALDGLPANASNAAILGAFTSKFHTLTPEQQARFDTLRARFASANHAPPDSPSPH